MTRNESLRDSVLLAVKMGKEGHEARNVGGLWKLERVRKVIIT